MSKLLELAAQVDVMDTANAIIARPERNAPAASTAEVVALAYAAERLWNICVFAEATVQSANREVPGENAEAARCRREVGAAEVFQVLTTELAALLGEPNTQE